MKKIFLILLLLSFFSCSKKNDELTLTKAETFEPETTIMGRLFIDGQPIPDVDIVIYNNGDTIYGKSDMEGFFNIKLN